MKSYFLEGLNDEQLARRQLTDILPNQVDPWLLKSSAGDPIAYFGIVLGDDDSHCIQADLSGRHFRQDEAVLRILRELQRRLGGAVRDDNDNAL